MCGFRFPPAIRQVRVFGNHMRMIYIIEEYPYQPGATSIDLPKKLLLAYEYFGTAVLVATYLFSMLFIWINSTVFGIETGHYLVLVNTNAMGEDYLELGILLATFPAAMLFLGRSSARIIALLRGE